MSSVLSKKLVKYAGGLEQSGIHIAAHQIRDVRTLRILCYGGDSNDGNDGKIEAATVGDFPSQPSHLSQGPYSAL